MRQARKQRVFACDFETTVYEGQEYTEVWSSAFAELFSNDVTVHHSIGETFDYFSRLDGNILLYYHNLKFDGAFWLDYLATKLHFKQGYTKIRRANGYQIEWKDTKHLLNNEYKYLISDMGQWYSIVVKCKGKIIEIRDSLKLLPFSLKQIGESFKTKHRKLDMEYTGVRYAGCPISDEEMAYIKNDVLVLKEALEIMYEQNHNKLTIGSCCFSEFKKDFDEQDFKNFFPYLFDLGIDKSIYEKENAGEYIRKAYRGGWCYVVKGKTDIIKHDGVTADVNSLYPSMMHSMSGNKYPVGLPNFWTGDIPEQAIGDNKYYFVRIRCRFDIKEGYLPFIQIKGNYLYRGTENLTTSDYYDEKTGQYSRYIQDRQGNISDTYVTMTMTMTDYALFHEHYNVHDEQILDGCWFYATAGLFDNYLNRYKHIKETSTGAIRQLAKLFMNNLYGKLATNTNSSFKLAYEDNGTINFITIDEHDKKAGYIPCGAAITSYARNFTIRAAQKNYYGVNERGFIYADTDSIHCDLKEEELKGIRIHPTDFCAWKIESKWDTGLFVRQKTYIEKAGDDIDVKCAGMPDKCKNLFLESLREHTKEELKQMEEDGRDKEEIEFLKTKRKLTDFKIGLKVYGKLIPKRIKGGIVLVTTTYEMR